MLRKWGWLVLLAMVAGCGVEAGRFGAVSCRPEAGVCLIFDSATGNFLFTPLPKLAADKAVQEVRNHGG